MAERIYPDVKVKDFTPNCYSPRGARIKLVIIHDTEGHNREGVGDLVDLGALFHNRVASCHVGVDAEGQSGRYVRDGDAAWQAVAYNRVSVGIENLGFASQSEWPEKQVKEAARWVALWSHHHGVPIRKAWTVNGRVLRSGVTTHRKLGAAGGNHSDPGEHYPMGHLFDLAKHYRKQMEAQS